MPYVCSFSPVCGAVLHADLHSVHMFPACFCNLLLNDCVFLVLYLQKVDPELIFTKQERIGKGSFGEVFKGVDNRTQQVSNRAPATSFPEASDEVLKQDKLSHGLPGEEKFSTLLRKTKLFFCATIPKGFCD